MKDTWKGEDRGGVSAMLNRNGLTLDEECHRDHLILGPLLFILYANDLTQAIRHSKVIQYADTVC